MNPAKRVILLVVAVALAAVVVYFCINGSHESGRHMSPPPSQMEARRDGEQSSETAPGVTDDQQNADQTTQPPQSEPEQSKPATVPTMSCFLHFFRNTSPMGCPVKYIIQNCVSGEEQNLTAVNGKKVKVPGLVPGDYNICMVVRDSDGQELTTNQVMITVDVGQQNWRILLEWDGENYPTLDSYHT